MVLSVGLGTAFGWTLRAFGKLHLPDSTVGVESAGKSRSQAAVGPGRADAHFLRTTLGEPQFPQAQPSPKATGSIRFVPPPSPSSAERSPSREDRPSPRSAPPEPPAPPPPGPDPAGEERRVRLGDELGRPIVARVYGGPRSKVVLLPDGQLGWPNKMIYTDEPFRPLTADELKDELLAGPYKGFKVAQTPHYLIVHQCSAGFARDSGKLLESLYMGLCKSLREKEIEIHEAEFPLIAVIFRTEADFRAHRPIDPDIQAYYEILSNRIFFYETRDGDGEAPEVTAMRRPQTVAHEGTHQVLQNIGVQPRMANWPLWLVEGLAELAAPTSTTRHGAWAGFSKVNPFHMATLHDLEDTRAIQGRSARISQAQIGRGSGPSMVEYIVTRDRLSPTDYALAWALTHYLANKRRDNFVAYLKGMSKMPPLVDQTPADHLRAFKKAFNADVSALGRKVNLHVSGLNYEPLPFYAVTFEQPVGDGLVRRGALVSQSPQIIREWFDAMYAERNAPYLWGAQPFARRAQAFQAIEQWIKTR